MTNQSLEQILEKVISIEGLMLQNRKILEQSLSISRKHDLILTHGIVGYKSKSRGSHGAPVKLYAMIRQDKSLRYPHRKILDFLIEQYDYEKGVFKEVHFSKIVRECRLGKNMAKNYLEFLVEKGYLGRRDDGYRVWYSVV